MNQKLPKSPSSLFSKNELKVIKILGRKMMEIRDLTKKFYNTKEHEDRNNMIALYIRRVNRKCTEYELNWKICGKGGGRGGRKVWKRVYV